MNFQDFINWLLEQQKNGGINQDSANAKFGELAQSWQQQMLSNSSDSYSLPLINGSNFGDTDISQLFGLMADKTSSSQFGHEMLAAYMQWLQTLNDREYSEGRTADERAYSETRLADERNYNNPSALLARLMSTGMSREQALQMLNGSAGAGGSVGVPAAIAPGAPGSVTSSADNSRSFANYAQGAASIAGALTSLIDCGINISTARATNSLAKAQTLAQNYTNVAQENSAALMSALWERKMKGDPINGMSFDQVGEYYSNDNVIAPLFKKAVSSPLGYTITSSNFNTGFSNQDKVSQTRSLMASAIADELKPQQLAVEIEKQRADIDKVFAEIENINLDTQFEQDSYDSRMNLVELDVTSMELQNEQSRVDIDYRKYERDMIQSAAKRLKLTSDDLDALAIAEVSRKLQIAEALNDPDTMKDTIAEIANNQKYMRAISAYNVYKMNNLQGILSSDYGDQLITWDNYCNTFNLGQMFSDYVDLRKDNPINGEYMFDDYIKTFGLSVKHNRKNPAKPKPLFGN